METSEQWIQKKKQSKTFTWVCWINLWFFQKTYCPSKDGIVNILSYYSGHYESYGLNCQYQCYAQLIFLYFENELEDATRETNSDLISGITVSTICWTSSWVSLLLSLEESIFDSKAVIVAFEMID